MIPVYIASKILYYKRFQKLRDDWRSENIDLHARWFDQAHHEDTSNPTPTEFGIYWMVDEEDVQTSKALIVYGEVGDKLRGALVEVGIAIANRIPVFTVGDTLDFGTWRHHPMVFDAQTLEHAKTLILRRFRL